MGFQYSVGSFSLLWYCRLPSTLVGTVIFMYVCMYNYFFARSTRILTMFGNVDMVLMTDVRFWADPTLFPIGPYYQQQFGIISRVLDGVRERFFELLQKEREIYTAQAADSGKPPEIVEKMIEGRIGKYLKENSLTEQPFVRDPDTSVGKLVKAAGASVVVFTRFEVGEGIEVEKVDFAAEVAAQLGG